MKLAITNPSKASVETITQRVCDLLDEGNIDVLDLWAELKTLEEAVKKIKDRTKDQMIEEVTKYGKVAEVKGIKFTRTSGRRIFHYDHHPEYVEAKNTVKAIEEKMKMAMKEDVIIVDEDTGEQLPPARVTYTSETIAIKLP